MQSQHATPETPHMRQEKTRPDDYGVRMEKGAVDRAREFAKLIRDGRLAKGWTQDQLIAESDITKSTLVRWENGRAERPEPDVVRSVCIALGIDPRRAALALGYLQPEDLTDPNSGQAFIPRAWQQVIDALEYDTLSQADKEKWVDYLMWLRDQSRGNGRAAG